MATWQIKGMLLLGAALAALLWPRALLRRQGTRAGDGRPAVVRNVVGHGYGGYQTGDGLARRAR